MNSFPGCGGLPDEEGGLTPAAALTAFARSEDRQRALISGFQSHIAKPVEPSELITLVASLAGRIADRAPELAIGHDRYQLRESGLSIVMRRSSDLSPVP